jgi:hypothetical protein
MPLDLEFSHQTPVREAGFVTLREGLRFPDTLSEATDTSTWQTWSPIDGGQVERHADGTARWAWRDGVQLPDPERLDEADRWATTMTEPSTGARVLPHYGDVARNPYLKRFVQVFTRTGGESAWLGELWVSVADTPFGPWSYARRVAAFDDYTLYNPMIHTEFDTDGRQVYFQGTYTTFFSGAPEATPRYDYNQLMFRLDLDDPRARLPVAYFADPAVPDPTPGPRLPSDATDPVVQFHAYEAPVADAVAVGRSVAPCAGGGWEQGHDVGDPRLWGEADPRPGLVPLWDDGGSLSTEPLPEGRTPLAWVWPTIGAPHVPAQDSPPPWRLDGGPDLCVVAQTSAGADVRLTADASDGAVRWTVGSTSAEGTDASIVLAPGDHVVQVTLATADGQVLEDVVLVHVDPAPGSTETDPPTDTTPGGDVETDPERPRTAAQPDATASCGCDQRPAVSSWLERIGAAWARRRSRR